MPGGIGLLCGERHVPCCIVDERVGVRHDVSDHQLLSGLTGAGAVIIQEALAAPSTLLLCPSKA
jgi:hypothetical protein